MEWGKQLKLNKMYQFTLCLAVDKRGNKDLANLENLGFLQLVVCHAKLR